MALSFGKDSLTTLDICVKIFPRVEAFYLTRVLGLRIVSNWCRWVRKKWNVKVRIYPHYDLSRIYRYAVLMPHWVELEDFPVFGMADVEKVFRDEAGVEWIAYGWRKSDSITRAVILKRLRGIDFDHRRVFPIYNWRRPQVYEYLHQHGIPTPPTLGRKEQGGLDFHPEALKYLAENYPDDWLRWLECFPFSPVMFFDTNK